MSRLQYNRRVSQQPETSKVIFIRTSPGEEKEVDLQLIVPYLMNFGKVSYIVTNPKQGHAFIEMQTIEEAIAAVNETHGRVLVLNGKSFIIQFSYSSSLNRVSYECLAFFSFSFWVYLCHC